MKILTTLVISLLLGIGVAGGAAQSRQSSPIPTTRLLSGHFVATGGIVDRRCNEGRGLDVLIQAHVTADFGYAATASTTLSNGETIVSIGPFGSSTHPFTQLFGFTADCRLLKDFGHNGSEALELPYQGRIWMLMLSPNGEIFIGAATGAGDVLLGLMRSNGTIDQEFASDGWSKLPWQGYPTAIVQEASGRILIGDSDSGGCCGYNWVGALTLHGAVQHDFGKNGLVTIPIYVEDAEIGRIVVEPNGEILAVTYAGHMGIWTTYPTAVSAHGVVLGGFRARFEQALRHLDPSEEVFTGDLLLRSNGFILIGTEQNHPVSGVPDASAVGRMLAFKSDGSADSEFGADGQTTFSSPLQQQVTAVPAPRSGVLMVGTDLSVPEPVSEKHQVVRIVALSASGRIDESYGAKGRSRVELPYGPNDTWSILITSSAHDVVLVVTNGGASFQLEEFRL